MPSSNVRGILSDMRRARTGVARRLKIHIATEPTVNTVAAASAYAQEPPSPANDVIVPATGTFREARVDDEYQIFGKDVARKCVVETHPMYEPTLRKAYSVEVSGEPGRFLIVGVTHDSTLQLCKVFIGGMD